MALWKDLIQNSNRIGSAFNFDQSARIKINKLDFERYTRRMNFQMEVSSSSRPIGYNVIISFLDINREDGLTLDELNQNMYPRPNLNNNRIQVNCRCDQFRFTCSEANKSIGAFTGPKFGFYRKKTNRESRNPNFIPCVCKHCLQAVDYLQKNGFIL